MVFILLRTAEVSRMKSLYTTTQRDLEVPSAWDEPRTWKQMEAHTKRDRARWTFIECTAFRRGKYRTRRHDEPQSVLSYVSQARERFL